MRRFLLLLLSCLIIVTAANASEAKPKRTSKSVKKERRMTAGEVERTRKQINQNAAETRRQLNRLQSLTAEANRCEKSITELNNRIKGLDSRIKELDDSITTMSHSLNALRMAYADNLREMRARRQMMSELAIIFSSQSFTEAYRRHRYLLEFERWQKDKTIQIKGLAEDLADRRTSVAEMRKNQASALASLTKENERLKDNKNETEKVVAGLRKQGSTLKKVLEEKQQQLKRLDDELDRIIAEEVRLAEEARKAEEARLAEEAKRKAEEARLAAEAKKKSTQGDTTVASNSTMAEKLQATKSSDNGMKTGTAVLSPKHSKAELIAMSGTFEVNKGKMPAPVTGKYAIVSHFGLNSHPDVSNIKINNSGIDIETTPGASARAVFDGEVSSVFRVSGYQNVVMLRHGNYLTVYAGIDKLSVKKGDKVKAGQAIGTVFSDADDNNRCVLHFEVRKERVKLNPEEWIK